jgi:nitrogen fixation-related uncharacterized protein
VNYKRVVLIAFSIWLVSSSVLADAKQDAQKRFQNGKELMKLEDFAGAVVELEQSVSLYPTKNGLFNLANCYKALHRYSEALATYARLRDEFGGKLDREMAELVKSDQEQIRELVGELDVYVDQTSATVLVDGAQIGQSPLAAPLVLGPGEHTIRATLAGYSDAEKKVQVASGAKSTVNLTLEAVAEKAVPAPAPDNAEVVSAESEQTTEDQADSEPSGKEGTRTNLAPWAWGAAGMTVLTTGAAIVFWALAKGKHDDLEKNRYDSNFDAANRTTSSDGKLFQGLEVGFGVAAGLFAVTTVVLFVLDSSSHEEQQTAAARLISPGRLTLRF